VSGSEHFRSGKIPAPGEAPAEHLVAIAFSAGGLRPLRVLLEELQPTFPAAIVITQHVRHRTELPEILRLSLRLPVVLVSHAETLCSGTVYVAPPEHHAFINPDRTFGLSAGLPVKGWRPSADWLFESAGAVFRQCGVAVVLSGRLTDGARGATRLKRAGGVVIAQAPATCDFASMPLAAIQTGCVDLVLPPDEMAAALKRAIVRQDGAALTREWEEPFGPT
jgi:two-component system chemotaxis response regulator CheB